MIPVETMYAPMKHFHYNTSLCDLQAFISFLSKRSENILYKPYSCLAVNSVFIQDDISKQHGTLNRRKHIAYKFTRVIGLTLNVIAFASVLFDVKVDKTVAGLLNFDFREKMGYPVIPYLM